jgi:ADP-heptose:LPS heptosyltransferase
VERQPPLRETLLHLGSGIGNIVFATPLLAALAEIGCVTDVLFDADYPQVAELFEDWSLVRRVVSEPSPRYDITLPALPPFYWPRRARRYLGNVSRRPPSKLFYQNEQEFYLWFARRLGFASHPPPPIQLPIAPCSSTDVTARTVALMPGSKTGEMTAKRWPGFAALAERFDDVAVLGSHEDATDSLGRRWQWPRHVNNLQGRLTLRESAETLAAAGVAVGNDSGLAHIAAAAGVPTVILFGPTPAATLGMFPSNVKLLTPSLPCAPCWFQQRFAQCDGRISCLADLGVDFVEQTVREHFS